MVYGYSRVSTRGQAKDGNSLQAQEMELKAAGADMVFSDTYTGTKKDRPELNRLLTTLEEGDVLVVTKFDRIARSITDGIELVEDLNRKGVRVNILNMGMVDDSPSGRLIRNIMFSFAEYERDMIITRMEEGKALARKRPGYREGRPPKYSTAQMDHAMQLLNEKSYTQVASMTGISKATLAREKSRRKSQKQEAT